MPNNIVWLASYPKSGNTWFRLFLNALVCDLDKIDINNLPIPTSVASERIGFLQATGLDSGDMTAAEIDRLRPEVHRYFSRHASGVQYHKVHDAYNYNDLNDPIFPTDVTKAAIYFVRNPLDVCISYTHHKGEDDYERTLAFLSNTDGVIAASDTKLHMQMPQRLGSWASHVESWLDRPSFDVFLMRYEDMLQTPLATFTAATHFLGLDKSEDAIKKALNACSFRTLQAQESEHGFREKMPHAERFFRAGEIAQWRGRLANEKIMQFIEQNQSILNRLGYLTPHNHYVY